MATDHEMRMEALKLFEENEALRGRLATARAEALEEVAQWFEDSRNTYVLGFIWPDIAKAIRALKEGKQ
jgi:hypothetical protein